MTKQILAIANCRVSTPEQEENGSLGRQAKAVLDAATSLGAVIPDDGQWSGSVSSKAGTNVNRKDLLEMLAFCKQNKAVKFAIFDEYDRFMRSVNEGPYFEVLFQELGVKVWYASESDAFNGDDAMAKFMRSMSAFKAEGSNEERQHKSIVGDVAAIKLGKYPFPPKAGYKKGVIAAVPDIDEVRGPALQSVLIRLANKLITPTDAVKELNKTAFVKGRALYKMDKFRIIATDPFYAGIIDMNKQVKARNERGLHDPLISLEQHEELKRIFDAKKKNQSGPRKNGNPKYPLSNMVSCDLCKDKSNGRYVGYDHGNGKSKTLVYEKYRCRGCARYMTRQELHTKVAKQFQASRISNDSLKDILEALNIVWRREEASLVLDAQRIKNKITVINNQIVDQVEAATNPSNASIKDNILAAITKKNEEVAELESELVELQHSTKLDKERFLKFAYEHIENMSSNFFELAPEYRTRCKQLIFPSGFYVDSNNKVYTPEISLLYRLASNKKDLSLTEKSFMVLRS